MKKHTHLSHAVNCSTNFCSRTLCLVLSCLMLVAAGPALGATYAERTEACINQLGLSLVLVDSGKLDEAQKVLGEVSTTVRTFKAESQSLRDKAVRQHDSCMVRVEHLQGKIDELYDQERDLGARCKELEAKIAGAIADEQLTQKEIVDVTAEMATALEQMRIRQAKLNELRKWWWVPGYGAYLSIRTLVDGDIGRYRSLVNTLGDYQTRLHHNQEALEAAKQARLLMQREQESASVTINSLKGMRENVRIHLTEIKKMVTALDTVATFCGRIEDLFSITIQGHEDDLRLLYKAMNDDIKAHPRFKDDTAAATKTLAEAMRETAGIFDSNGDLKLLQEAAASCDAPLPTQPEPVKPASPVLHLPTLQ